MAQSNNNLNNLSSGVDPDNTFKILIATDIHLGYDENNPITGKIFFLFIMARNFTIF